MTTRAGLSSTNYTKIDGRLKRAAASPIDGQPTMLLGAANTFLSESSSKHPRLSPLEDNVVPALKYEISDASDSVSHPQEPEVMLTIFREGAIHEFCVRLGKEDGMGTRRIVHWCGAQIQVSS